MVGRETTFLPSMCLKEHGIPCWRDIVRARHRAAHILFAASFGVWQGIFLDRSILSSHHRARLLQFVSSRWGACAFHLSHVSNGFNEALLDFFPSFSTSLLQAVLRPQTTYVRQTTTYITLIMPFMCLGSREHGTALFHHQHRSGKQRAI